MCWIISIGRSKRLIFETFSSASVILIVALEIKECGQFYPYLIILSLLSGFPCIAYISSGVVSLPVHVYCLCFALETDEIYPTTQHTKLQSSFISSNLFGLGWSRARGIFGQGLTLMMFPLNLVDCPIWIQATNFKYRVLRNWQARVQVPVQRYNKISNWWLKIKL